MSILQQAILALSILAGIFLLNWFIVWHSSYAVLKNQINEADYEEYLNRKLKRSLRSDDDVTIMLNNAISELKIKENNVRRQERIKHVILTTVNKDNN